MTDQRLLRQRALANLLRSDVLASQEEVQERLRELGMTVTQATVSRDLEQLGAIKVRREGRTVYAMPDQPGAPDRALQRLQSIAGEWVRSAEPVGQLVIIRTPPGSAHLVGVALDSVGLASIAGTICGDDTVFLAVRDAKEAPRVASWIAAGALTPPPD